MTTDKEKEEFERQVVLEKVRLPTRIKEEDVTEDLARRLRAYSDDIVASDIEDWKRAPIPKKIKRVDITITFYEASKAQTICENAERTKRSHEVSRKLTKEEKEHNRKQWLILNSKNMTDPDTTKVWLPKFEKGVIVKINEYPDTLDRRKIMKDVVNARLQGKEFLQMIPDPPL